MAPKCKGSNKGSGKKCFGKKPGQVLAGPRKPTWTCSCGKEGNWASRVSCYECGKLPPAVTLKLALENAAKQGGGNSVRGKGQAAAKEEEEDVLSQCGERGSVLKPAGVNAALRGGGRHKKGKGQAAAKESKEEGPRLRVAREGGEALKERGVPFKRNLQQALLHKQRVEARVRQAVEVLEGLRRQRHQLDVEVEGGSKRVVELLRELAATEEEVRALRSGTSECHWCRWRPPCCGGLAWGAGWGSSSVDQAKVKLGVEEQRAQERGLGPEVTQEAEKAAGMAKVEAAAAAEALEEASAADSGMQGVTGVAGGEAEAFKVPAYEDGAGMDLDVDEAAAANIGKQGIKDGADGEAEAPKVPEFDECAGMVLDLGDGDLEDPEVMLRAIAASCSAVIRFGVDH
jgi:hypothetical protein